MYEYQRRLLKEVSKYQKMKKVEEALEVKVGKVTFVPFKEGSIKGWKIKTSKGEMGFVEEPSKKNTKATVSPHKVFLYDADIPKHVLSAWPKGKAPTNPTGSHVEYDARKLLDSVAAWLSSNQKKVMEQIMKENTDTTRAQVHYMSKDGYGKMVKIIATVPPMQEPGIDSKYDLVRYLEKYIKRMKELGVIKSKYEIVYPHDPRWIGKK